MPKQGTMGSLKERFAKTIKVVRFCYALSVPEQNLHHHVRHEELVRKMPKMMMIGLP